MSACRLLSDRAGDSRLSVKQWCSHVQAMAEEMAELTATGSPEVEGPVSREDSAHDMAQGEDRKSLC